MTPKPSTTHARRRVSKPATTELPDGSVVFAFRPSKTYDPKADVYDYIVTAAGEVIGYVRSPLKPPAWTATDPTGKVVATGAKSRRDGALALWTATGRPATAIAAPTSRTPR